MSDTESLSNERSASSDNIESDNEDYMVADYFVNAYQDEPLVLVPSGEEEEDDDVDEYGILPAAQ